MHLADTSVLINAAHASVAVLVHDDADYERIADVTVQELLRLGRANATT
jgi:hypothetical protein